MNRRGSLSVALFLIVAGAIFAWSAKPARAVIFSITFFSQNYPQWACEKLGTCPGTTIGACGNNTPAGCAISAIASLLKYRGADVNPAMLNNYLKANGGYSGGCNVVWSKAAEYDGRDGLAYVGTGSLTTPQALKSYLDGGGLVLARSSRFSEHWAVIRGYRTNGARWDDFVYIDPWDSSAINRSVGDGWVGSGASTRNFR